MYVLYVHIIEAEWRFRKYFSQMKSSFQIPVTVPIRWCDTALLHYRTCVCILSDGVMNKQMKQWHYRTTCVIINVR